MAYAKWDSRQNPDAFIIHLNAATTISSKRTIEFHDGFFSIQIYRCIASAVDWSDEAPPSERLGFTRQAINNLLTTGNLQEQPLINEINNCAAAYRLQPEIRFQMIFDISASNPGTIGPFYVNGSKIVFEKTLPKKVRTERHSFLTSKTSKVFGDMPTHYSSARVWVDARSVSEAGDKAIDSMDLLRGIWNIGLNSQTSWRISDGQDPVNKIVLGPLHSLHNPDGTLVPSIWWFDDTYRGPVNVVNLHDKYGKLKKFEGSFRRKIRNSPHKRLIEEALIRYVRALDDRNMQSSFLSLWGVLELVTLTKNAKYESTVKRAAIFHGDDYQVALGVLNHLRSNRNQAIHSGKQHDNAEELVYQLKNFIETIIFFLGSVGEKLNTTDDLEAFMTLPKDKAALKRKIAITNSRIRFQNKKTFDDL